MKNRFYKALSLAMAGMMTVSAFAGGAAVSTVTAEAADGYVSVDALTDKGTAAPEADEVVPDANQYEYQKQELAAFCHFGPNTFNEIEWGEHYGSKSPDTIFKLETNFDADTMVEAFKSAGFEKLIVTAKHHDGFCIWNSAYTEYDVESTSYAEYDYDGMGGDVLAEISAACTKYDVDMGLYLSPWDIHDASYGYYDANGNPTSKENDVLDYNDYYDNQLNEILGNDIYGNDGHFVEVWMDGAKGSGANAQDYDFLRWFTTIQKHEGIAAGYEADCMLFGAEAYTTVRWIGNESGYADETTWAKSTVNYDNNTINSNSVTTSSGKYTRGLENGNKWTVPEADARITSGWFWGNTKKTPKTVEALAEMYFRSVGHNATFLLNMPPNDQGALDQAILDRIAEFGDNVKETFANNRAKNALISATEVRGNDVAYSPANVLDGNDATYWTVNDGTKTGTMLVEFDKLTTFDVVSIEEAIQFGQRITSFKVEYRGADGNWKVFDEGTTIGSKRLSRGTPVKADAVRITVSTESTLLATPGVPMISEVGVFKASEGFELAAAAPDGMTIIDNTDSAFNYTGNWKQETGSQYLNETNVYSVNGNAASATLKFTGSKIYLVGTIDPNHGAANITIDDGEAVRVDTYSPNRATGTMYFVSEDLADGEHTLKISTANNKPIAIEGAYVINNGGKGMVGIEESRYTMNEDSELEVKLVREGGTKGEVTVTLSPNPGSAIQDDFDTECISVVTFAEGETEKTATVRTTRNTNQTGDQYFTVELSTDDSDLILGFNYSARINIIDTEGITVEKLAELVESCEGILPGSYAAAEWEAFADALAEAQDVAAMENASNTRIKNAYDELEAAKEALVAKDKFTAEDPFIFPDEAGASAVLEGELATKMVNVNGNANWPLQITDAEWASNGKFLNCLDDSGDYAEYAYYAPYAGTYKAVLTYRSGASGNSLQWTEADGKIEAGSVSAGNDDASVTKTAVFSVVVKEAGAGTLKLIPGSSKAPQIDKIVFTSDDLEYTEYEVTVETDGNGTSDPESPVLVAENETKTISFVGNPGYIVSGVVVDGKSVGAVSSYTVKYPTADVKIEVTFAKDPAYAEGDIPVSAMKATAGDSQSGQGPENVLDGNSDSLWHTTWTDGAGFDDHWIMFELDEAYVVDGLRYQPRQQQTNGMITEYEIYTSLDGETWELASEGAWPINADWKTASFDPVKAKFVKLVTINADSEEAGNDYSSAAEIRLTGSMVTCDECVPADELAGVKEATCTEDGYTGDTVCKNCGAVITKGEVVEAKGHVWGDWTVDTEPTVDAEGLEKRTCETCGTEETRAMDKLDPPAWVNPFEDVEEGKWYYDAVAWGSQNGVVNGLTETLFGTKDNCTRGQIITFIWRAMGEPKADSAEYTFKDVEEGKYYFEAMLWGVEKGIITGYDADTFAPNDQCTRAQMATFIWRLAGKPEAEAEASMFPDVEEGKWYTTAATWAAENEVVTGYDDGTFGPDNNVLRSETITMLYRYFVK